MHRRPRWSHCLSFAVVAAAATALDHLSKAKVREHVVAGARAHVGPLRIHHLDNHSIGLALYHGSLAIDVGLGVVAVLILVVFAAWGGIYPAAPVACAAAFGGVLGNVVDRHETGGITDFVVIGPLPVFNLADAFIVLGLGVMTVLCFVSDYRAQTLGSRAEEEPDAPRAMMVTGASLERSPRA